MPISTMTIAMVQINCDVDGDDEYGDDEYDNKDYDDADYDNDED